MAGRNARLRLFVLLQAQGVPVAEADDLVADLEASAATGAQSEVVELDGIAPASQGARFADGWDEGVAAASEALVGITHRDWVRHGGRSAGAAELAVRIADVRRRERAALVRLEAFVRETVLPCTHPDTTARRRVLEAVGEAGGLSTARTVEMSSGDVILCTLEVGHYGPGDLPGFKRGKSDGTPGGWHLAGRGIWSDAGAACTLHTTV
ncbi:hypothetical protein ACIQCD_29945 [Streptomyces sp. NPDC093250]|uniref:hypothetical protein n=1 Tax=Streptomyces sp. NPDC093250 TaxID=3366036 RepID=UPI00381D7D19